MADFILVPQVDYDADANDMSNAVLAFGVTSPATVTGLTNSTAYYAMEVVRSPISAAFTPSDVTAPTLSSPTGAANGATGAQTLGVTTSEAGGTLYWGIYPDASTPTAADIVAGTGATVNGSQAVSVTGAQSVAGQTGLTASTAYRAHYVHDDASANRSAAAASATFTTTAATGGVDNWVQYTGLTNYVDAQSLFTTTAAETVAVRFRFRGVFSGNALSVADMPILQESAGELTTTVTGSTVWYTDFQTPNGGVADGDEVNVLINTDPAGGLTGGAYAIVQIQKNGGTIQTLTRTTALSASPRATFGPAQDIDITGFYYDASVGSETFTDYFDAIDGTMRTDNSLDLGDVFFPPTNTATEYNDATLVNAGTAGNPTIVGTMTDAP